MGRDCIHTDIYVGRNEEFDPDLGFGGSVAANLTRKIRSCYPETKFCEYFYNFFMCPKFLTKQKENNFLATGKVKTDRTDKYPLVEKKTL